MGGVELHFDSDFVPEACSNNLSLINYTIWTESQLTNHCYQADSEADFGHVRRLMGLIAIYRRMYFAWIVHSSDEPY